MQPSTDVQLHELARKRVDFRRHLTVYVIINAMLWTIWFVTGKGYPWPVWPMAGWGIGVIFQYLFEYRSSRFLSEEEEFLKLKRETEERDRVAH
jgi:hypothetical protein